MGILYSLNERDYNRVVKATVASHREGVLEPLTASPNAWTYYKLAEELHNKKIKELALKISLDAFLIVANE